jgi:hypothetical protein
LTIVPDGESLLAGSSPGLLQSVARAAIVLWLLASVVLAIRLARAALLVRGIRARAERCHIDGLPVLVTETLGPATIGLRDRAVIVPRSMLALEEPLRGLVLLHEGEHCAAGDPWHLLSAGVAVVLFPWNAALWFIAHRLRLALEIDCDARVLASGAEPRRYGQLLLWMAQHRGSLPLAPMLAAGHSHLERRIIAMRTHFARPRVLHLSAVSALFVIAIIAACSEGAPNGPLAGSSSVAQPSIPVVPAPSAAAPANVDGPYFEFQVENQAQQIPRSGNLKYPVSMRTANRDGEVLAQFVVDERGMVDLGTFKALTSSDPAFTAAVVAALPTMRFTPARIGGKAVRQLVQQPFTFSLHRT